LLAQKTRFKSGGTIGLTASPIEATTLNQLDATSTLPKENSSLRYILYRARTAVDIHVDRIFDYRCGLLKIL
ncbi:MAG: hypothetical protein IJ774_11140, partial [Selenomonadaceae bacterium]|nr:hypothetical protein [Selenomonadaceae bacterium]